MDMKNLLIIHTFAFIKWRRVRVVEGARLESVYMGNRIASSNLAVSAKTTNFIKIKNIS